MKMHCTSLSVNHIALCNNFVIFCHSHKLFYCANGIYTEHSFPILVTAYSDGSHFRQLPRLIALSPNLSFSLSSVACKCFFFSRLGSTHKPSCCGLSSRPLTPDADQSRAVRKVLQRVRKLSDRSNIRVEGCFLADRFRLIGGLDWSIVKPLRTLKQILTLHDGHGRTRLCAILTCYDCLYKLIQLADIVRLFIKMSYRRKIDSSTP